MDAEKAAYDVTRMARLLEVSRSGYYGWVARQAAGPTPAQQRRVQLVEKIKAFHQDSDEVYGAPRILADLREDGEVVSAKTVAKLMRVSNIRGISPRKRAVRDGHSRRVLGWAVEDHMRSGLVETALTRAVTLRGHLPGQVIFHADRGTQYTSAQVAGAAGDLGVLRSMGRTGVCWDNAAAETFWSTLKCEFYNRRRWHTKREARLAVGAWIEDRYNRRRRHSSIGMLSPVRYEDSLAQTATAA
jgi:transposase InsO family protein